MFCPGVVDIVLDVLESGVRVGENERRLFLRNIDRGKEIAEEQGDFRGFRQSKIFPFHAREGDSVGLLVRFPNNHSAVIEEDNARG